MQTLSVGAARITGLPARSRRYRQGRTCSQPGCETVLSVYNKAGTCWVHSPAKIPRTRGRPGLLGEGSLEL